MNARQWLLLILAAAPLMAGCIQDASNAGPGEFDDDGRAPRNDGDGNGGPGTGRGPGQGIIGGGETQRGAYPGVVILGFGGSAGGCGGTLIADGWVLTAAHCADDATKPNGGVAEVFIERHRLSGDEGEVRPVRRVILHSGYNASTSDNDIALLELASRSNTPKVNIIGATEVRALAPDAMTTIVGWGRTAEGGQRSDVQREVSVPSVPNDTCKALGGAYANVTSNMICAGVDEGGKSSCNGDSGGPLFTTVNGKVVQIGITSWAVGCGRAKAPSVFTRVGNYLGWIYENTGGAAGEQGFATSVALTWEKKSNDHTYSLDVQLTSGEWLWPCVNADILTKKLAYTFTGECPSVVRSPGIAGIKAFRICYTPNNDWNNAKCDTTPYDGRKTSLQVVP